MNNSETRCAQATGPVADKYFDSNGDPRPIEFLTLVCSTSGGISGLQSEYGGGERTWRRYIKMAQAASGIAVEYREDEHSWRYVENEEGQLSLAAKVQAEIATHLEDGIGDAPEADDEQRAQASDEMERKLSDDDEPEAHGDSGRDDLPAIALEDNLPSVFHGGKQGGKAEHPGANSTPQERFNYYMARTDVWESVHQVRLAVVPGKPYAVIHPIGDVHVGDDECDFRKFYALIDWIAGHPGHYVLGMGDYLEASTLGSVRAPTIADQVLTLGDAGETFAMAMQRVRDRIICLGEGNHEAAPKRDTGQDLSPLKPICDALQVARAPYDYPLEVLVGDQAYMIGVHHGTGGARTLGGIWNEVERQLNNNEIDAAIMGHAHAKGAVTRGKQGTIDDPVRGRVWDTKALHMIRSGSFKKYIAGSYARTKNMQPAVRGTVAIRVYATHRNIHPRS